MSSTPANAKAPAAPPRKAIDIRSNQPALLVTNLHPVVLASFLLVGFPTLVRDPVSSLLGLAPTIAVVQLLYCVVCLPTTSQAPALAPKAGQKKRASRPTQDVWARIVPAFLSLLLTLTLATPLLYIVVILFGAPLTSHQPHTLLLALHLALLTSPQLFYAHGLHAETWLRIASLQLPVDELYGMTLGACVGSWVGAIPIPLDWDREWQKWPVTVVTGMYAGAVIGKLVGGYLLKGAKMKIT